MTIICNVIAIRIRWISIQTVGSRCFSSMARFFDRFRHSSAAFSIWHFVNFVELLNKAKFCFKSWRERVEEGEKKQRISETQFPMSHSCRCCCCLFVASSRLEKSGPDCVQRKKNRSKQILESVRFESFLLYPQNFSLQWRFRWKTPF